MVELVLVEICISVVKVFYVILGEQIRRVTLYFFKKNNYDILSV